MKTGRMMAEADDDIDADVRAHVGHTLHDVCRTHGVRILYAAESGSRAWGFGSPDSDYDVRFIYAHPPIWYLDLAEPRDVIERPLDDKLVDLAGWDVRKALRLLLKSNPALYEWLVSPIVYVDDGSFRARARTLFEQHASPRTLAAHYWSIARGQWKSEIDGRSEVRLKKYFYVVRPLLSLQQVAQHGAAPPMDIAPLLGTAGLPSAVEAAIRDLLVTKRATPELGTGARLAAIDDWALQALDRLAPERLSLPDRPQRAASEAANALFRQTIGLGAL
jgi:predicted nucleotidyltransferase